MPGRNSSLIRIKMDGRTPVMCSRALFPSAKFQVQRVERVSPANLQIRRSPVIFASRSPAIQVISDISNLAYCRETPSICMWGKAPAKILILLQRTRTPELRMGNYGWEYNQVHFLKV